MCQSVYFAYVWQMRERDAIYLAYVWQMIAETRESNGMISTGKDSKTAMYVPHVSEIEPVESVYLPHVSEIGARRAESA